MSSSIGKDGPSKQLGETGEDGKGITKQSTTRVISQSALECAVCLALICQPVSLSCGHTFCRSCVVTTLRRNKKKCPSCRAVCHNNAEDQPENVMIADIVRTCFPDESRKRMLETETERSSWKALLPVFYYNLPMFPGETLHLHLFEPRYKLMMQRIIGTSRRFAYVPNYTQYMANIGDVALVAEVRECEFLSDGRVLLEAKLLGRHVVVDHFVEEGTQGLHYCMLEEREDEIPDAEGAVCLKALHKRARELANQVIGPVKAQVMATHGEMPSTPQGLSMWIASILPMAVAEKHSLLSSTSTIRRLEGCLSLLEAMGATGRSGPKGSDTDRQTRRTRARGEAVERAGAGVGAEAGSSPVEGEQEREDQEGGSEPQESVSILEQEELVPSWETEGSGSMPLTQGLSGAAGAVPVGVGVSQADRSREG